MYITDLQPEHESLFFLCLEDWSSEIREAGPHKADWYNKMKNRGLCVKLAVDNGTVCGMIQLVPAENSFAEGSNFYFIHCIWVHGYREGIGNYQKRGIGKVLLLAAEDEAKEKGASGLAAWGLSLPVWMQAKWFIRQGYKKADRVGQAVLVWKAFDSSAETPKWIRLKKKPEKTEGKINVTAFLNGWCPAQNIVFERMKRAVAEFGDIVDFTVIDTTDRKNYLEWGISDGIYLDGKSITTGPPLSYDKIRRLLARKVRKINPK
ncbi:MAG: GNAT family N-acetyltransferase [Spirochaetales bacterium]|nr:GNAT family N-acetyltransferase [Spirochaetales bacterium]